MANKSPKTHDVAIVGAGAAGLMAAIIAGRAGADVVLLEGSARVGTKIRASGGGRCNVLPSRVDEGSFWSHSHPRTMTAVLAALPLAAARAVFERDLGLPLKTEASGKVFPASDRADDVVRVLLEAVAAAGVELRRGARVEALDMAESRGDEGGDNGNDDRGDDGRISGDARAAVVRLEGGDRIAARRVVLAAGGLALPKSGSDGSGLRFAEGLGHRVERPYPALVPITIDAPDLRALSGISLPCRLAVVGADGRELAHEHGDLLLTHRGLSGPAVLQISRHLTEPDAKGRRLRIHWGEADWPAILADGSGGAKLGATLRAHLPTRLALALIARSGRVEQDRIASLRRSERAALLALLRAFEPVVTGSEGFKTAEVTGGGVRLDEVNAATLESRVVPGLHLCGEVLDATGRLGGYNFLWAWASGKVAGLGAARSGRRQGR